MEEPHIGVLSRCPHTVSHMVYIDTTMFCIFITSKCSNYTSFFLYKGAKSLQPPDSIVHMDSDYIFSHVNMFATNIPVKCGSKLRNYNQVNISVIALNETQLTFL